jgi:hypothetical protein
MLEIAGLRTYVITTANIKSRATETKVLVAPQLLRLTTGLSNVNERI